MTAFLTVDVLRAHAAPNDLHLGSCCVDVSHPAVPAGWLIAPDARLMCGGRKDGKAPEFPPDR